MRTFIAEYDLSHPVPTIWGVEGYDYVTILVRNHGRPLDIIRFPHNPAECALSRPMLEKQIEYKLRITPSFRPLFSTMKDDGERQEPAISVIVCTRDRPLSLQRCLNSLQKLDYSRHEIIIVDNASRSDETEEVVAASGFRYVREERPGLDWARNRGLKEARYDILAYVDDDVRVDPGWLRGIAKGFESADVEAVTGLILPFEMETQAQHLYEAYGDGMSKGFKAKRYNASYMSAWELIEIHALGAGANMAFRRSTLKATGGFDTALDVGTPSGGGGDLDMFHRVLMADGVLRYEPNALVWHQHRRDRTGLRRQLYNNGRSFGVYLIKLWKTGQVRRQKVLSYFFRRWGRWLFWRIMRGLFRRHHLPLPLLWAEFWGALHAPWAYIATYRHDQKLRTDRYFRCNRTSADQTPDAKSIL
jgi:glycosyltransferase involved in cell wall biosynthesis